MTCGSNWIRPSESGANPLEASQIACTPSRYGAIFSVVPTTPGDDTASTATSAPCSAAPSSGERKSVRPAGGHAGAWMGLARLHGGDEVVVEMRTPQPYIVSRFGEGSGMAAPMAPAPRTVIVGMA